MRKHAPIEVGHRFGKLEVLGDADPYINPNTGKRHRRLLCACDCGRTSTAMPGDLRRGFTKSCGCVQGRQTIEHGHARRSRSSPEYTVWATMLTRCTNPNAKAFKNYGGRGITVCERWRSFENFLTDMGRRPAGLTLDRIDNDGPYSPDNCRWATRYEQALNTRKATVITFNGVADSINGWARRVGVSGATMYYRIKRGWPLEIALGHADKINNLGVKK